MTPPVAATELPSRLGRYLLGPVVGVGSAAVVVRARDTRHDLDVAIKLLRVASPGLAERFLADGRRLRELDSPSVVRVHYAGESVDGRPYLVMDLARDSLADRLRSAELPADAETLKATVAALAEGLAALHAAGIVHRSITPANLLLIGETWAASTGPGILLAPDERLVVADPGVAVPTRMAKRDLALLDPTAVYRAPEWDAEAAPDVRTDVYAASAVLWTLAAGRRPPAPETLAVEVQAVPAEWREVFLAGLAGDPERRFPDIGSWAAAAREVLGIGTVAVPVPRRPAAVSPGTAPYRGLAPFQPADAPLFFGRAALVETLLDRLARHPVLVVAGASGSGKSSLLRAGLLPRLEAGALPGSADRTTCLFTPGDAPLRTLAEQLTAAGATGLTAEVLRRDPAAALEALHGPVLLAIDQFEELFTLCPDPREQDAFLEVMAVLSGAPVPPARVVLTVRADFYAACAARPWLAAAVNGNQVLVEPMAADDLRAAVEGPAGLVNLQLEDGLTQRLLQDTGADPGALPLLAHALCQTWLRREANVLTVAAYEAVGGVAGAVERTAEAVWAVLDERDHVATRRLMLRLVQTGDGTPDVRRTLRWIDLSSSQRELLGPFVEARILTLDTDGIRFAHEAVLHSWGRLAGWLVESREERRVGVHMEHAAAEWERGGRRGEQLLRGVALAAALDWRDRQHGDVPFQVASFLTEAETAASEDLAAADAQDARTERSRRRVLVGLGIVAVGSLALSAVLGVGLLQSGNDEAVAPVAAAPPVAPAADAQALAASARALAQTDPFLATALAVQSGDRGTLVQARLALAGDRLVPFGTPIPVVGAQSLALRSAGDLAAVGRRDGSIDVLALGAGHVLATLTGPSDGVRAVAFSPDGLRLNATGGDGATWEWDVSGADLAAVPGRQVAGSASGVSASDASLPIPSGDGRVAVSLTETAAVQVWTRAPRPGPVARIAGLGSTGGVLALAPDAATLAVGLADGSVRLLDPSTGVERAVLRGGGAAIGAVAFLGADRVATGDSTGALRVFAIGGGPALLERLGAHSGAVGGLQSIEDGVLSVGADGAVRLWGSDLTEPRKQAQLGGDLTDVAADPAAESVLVVSRSGQTTRWTPQDSRIEFLGGTGATAWGAALAGSTLAVSRADGTLAAWSLAGDSPAVRWERSANLGGANDVTAIGSEVFAVPAGDGQVRFWDATTGAPLGPALPAGGTGLRQIVAGPDGTVWTVDRDGAVYRSDVLSTAAACAALGQDWLVRTSAPVCR
ncbi:MAG: nSTAND1 domain-containing NTPase [Sporichthyaceae bacterium]